MMYRVIIQPNAEAQIQEAFEHIHQRSRLNAERWLRGLYDAIFSLQRFPRRCGRAREADRFSEELRQFIYESHRIIFTIEGNIVRVLQVRHGARRGIGEPAPDEDDA